MNYLRYLFYPINQNYLYHTYIDNIVKIIRVRQNMSYIYFSSNSSIKFYLERDKFPEEIYVGEYVLVNYHETISNTGVVSFYIKTIDIISTESINTIRNNNSNKFESMIYCLTCGNTLPIKNVVKCDGNITSHYQYWDDFGELLLTPIYKGEYCDSCHYGGRGLCETEKCRCKNCYTTRIIRW